MLWYQMYFLHKEDYSNLRLISVIDLIFLAVFQMLYKFRLDLLLSCFLMG